MNNRGKEILRKSDLLVDAIYSGGRSGNASDDPLNSLVGVSNQGGFRYIGSKENPRLIVLTSTLKNPDWPDNFDEENGIYTYFGDNKEPGRELHDTPRFGNLLLRDAFERAHGAATDRIRVPPILVFANTGEWRDVRFLGLAVPGAQNLNSNQDLVAVWKMKNGLRFQNYQAKFTILDCQVIPKDWINSVINGNPFAKDCPSAWKLWVETGALKTLKAPRVLEYRKKEEQLPVDEVGKKIIKIIHEEFAENPFRFERCAGEIAKMMLKNIVSVDVTRPTRDGGRDAIGKFRIGEGDSSVLVDFALEAKCYDTSNPVAVKELSRLISRLRHRQFGILVTTSYVAQQAYQEIKEDEHPIVIISAVDIVKILKAAGINYKAKLRTWLKYF